MSALYKYEKNTHYQRPGKVGGEKHEIYVAAFGGHLFYDLFSQGRGTMAPALPPPGSTTYKQ